MRVLFVPALTLATAGLFALAPGCKKTEQVEPDATVDEGLPPDASVTEAPVTQKNVGEPCTDNKDCLTNICAVGLCRKTCLTPSDCKANEDCGSDDGKRSAFCYERTYSSQIGESCAVTVNCASTMKCYPAYDVAYAYCTAECKDNTGCPPTFVCQETTDGTPRYCGRRTFCDRCQHDGQCSDGGKCVKQGKEAFCTLPCHEATTECPRFADCTNIGGAFQCVHRSGTCVGDGTQCSACTVDSDCQKDAKCLSYNYSHESFCASSCATAACPGGSEYECAEIGATKSKQCVPSDEDAPSCVSPITPTMEVGDTLPDFAMVGYVDENGDFTLKDEIAAGKLRVVKLSDFKDSKIILFNVAAGWCVPCMMETSTFADLMKTYKSYGLMIFQVLYDGQKEGDRPKVPFLTSWIKGTINIGTSTDPNIVALNPVGTCGIDPTREVSPWNTNHSTPLNLIVDAKTRKVLLKFNAAKPPGFADIETALKKYLGLGI